MILHSITSKGRPLAPKGQEWEKAMKYWKTLHTDEGAKFDYDIKIAASDIVPTITWGNSPQDALPITASVPDPATVTDQLRNRVWKSIEISRFNSKHTFQRNQN